LRSREGEALERLVSLLREWTETLGLRPLSQFGVGGDDLPEIVAHCRGASMRTNPIALTDAEVTAIVSARL